MSDRVQVTLDIPKALFDIVPDVARVFADKDELLAEVLEPGEPTGALEKFCREELKAAKRAGKDIRFSREVALTMLGSNVCDDVQAAAFRHLLIAIQKAKHAA